MASNKTVKKGIRLTPEYAQEIEDRMAKNGIPDFNGFCEQAFRHYLKHLDDCDTIRHYDIGQLLDRLKQFEKQKNAASTPVDILKVAEQISQYPRDRH